jgi:phage antirepressor YoqD-like protein
MNALITVADGQTVTMTSLDLVEFINSQRAEGEAVLAHSDFLKKVPQVLGAEVAGNFSGYYKASNGKQNPMYTFPKREACLMAMSYSYDLQAKVFDRMTALEQQAAKPALNPANLSRLQLIEMAMQAEQERLALEEKTSVLEEKVAEQAPKVEALDRIATYSDGSFCIRDAAKNLQVQEKRLRQWMNEHDWIYRRPMGSGWLAYSDKLKAGVLEHKITTGNKADGSDWADTQVRVTAKGLAKLALLVPPDGFFPPPIKGSNSRPVA